VVDRDAERNYLTYSAESWMGESERRETLTRARLVRSTNRSFAVPEIIVLSHFDRLPRKDVKFTRQNVFARDRHVCQYCAKLFEPKDLNLDHVIPRDKGGRTSWENVVTSCIRCNTKKANKMPAEARMIPLQIPRAPRWRPFHCALRLQAIAESWRDFLDIGESAVQISE
jgi:5-methylcytosine-specific restriction endonuclease McrA